LDRTGAVPSVCRPLFRLADTGASALVVWGAGEYGLQRTREKSQWALDELARRPGCRIEIIADVDHGLMNGAGRDEVAALVTAHLMATFGAVSATDLDRADQGQ
ncbi:MAG TPA: hypothetical protein VED63_13400, partial [Acidimicrobiales bacterium]|nr:hypothetical protein [Acidimicrobiales bacterium]